MYQMSAAENLGKNVLVVVENCSDCLHTLREIVSAMPNASSTNFTLMHCCPTTYWEHGGAAESSLEFRRIWEAEEQDFTLTHRYLDQAGAILRNVGVDDTRIFRKMVLSNDLPVTALDELKQGQYTGLIVCNSHTSLLNRLHGHGIANLFNPVPQVALRTFATE